MKDIWRLFSAGFRRGWRNTALSERALAFWGITGAIIAGTAMTLRSLV